MRLRELIKNLSIIEMNADAELEISGVSYDSRKTEKRGYVRRNTRL